MYESVSRHPLRQLDVGAFRVGLQSSGLCCPEAWTRLDIDGLAQLYDAEITATLDELVPVKRSSADDGRPTRGSITGVALRSVVYVTRSVLPGELTDYRFSCYCGVVCCASCISYSTASEKGNILAGQNRRRECNAATVMETN